MAVITGKVEKITMRSESWRLAEGVGGIPSLTSSKPAHESILTSAGSLGDEPTSFLMSVKYGLERKFSVQPFLGGHFFPGEFNLLMLTHLKEMRKGCVVSQRMTACR